MGDDKLDSLKIKFEEHVETEDKRWSQLIETQKEYTKILNKYVDLSETNAQHIAKIDESTEGLVDAWKTLVNIGKFAKWVVGLSVLVHLILEAVETFGL